MSRTDALLLRGVDLAGEIRDVRISDGRIAAIGTDLPDEAATIEARGGALLPGLHDHHLHLLAWARAEESVPCGPPAVHDAAELERRLSAARPIEGWIRGVGYHESVAGRLDRGRLDRLRPEVPLRIQHRSGAAWFLNGAALRALGLEDEDTAAEGIERDESGRPTGVLHGLDGLLRERLPSSALPDLARIGRKLAGFGVTGVTDATPHNGLEELAHFAEAVAKGALTQSLRIMGSEGLPRPTTPGLERGELKILLRESRLPTLDALERAIARSHAAGRPVAIHCVTRTELVFASAALEGAGVLSGDRIEHASIAPPEAVRTLAALGVAVVTQPNFIRERGDAYLEEVEARELPWLYRCAGFLEAGVALGGGTDAPFGDPDPWRAMQAAVDRRSAAGAALAPDEALPPERALALFTTPAAAPGASPRRIAIGAPAHLCLLDRPWKQARDRLDAQDVVATLHGTAILFAATEPTAPARSRT